MTSFYFIKLYHEILDDPKMARLPDYLWRRVVELFLLAGDHGRDGTLPPVADMAWRLRVEENRLCENLRTLAEIGIVTETELGWMVTKFKERQAHVSNTERVRRFRERETQMKRDRNGDETKRSAEEDKEIDIEVDIDKELEEEAEKKAAAAAVFSHYHENIGEITETTREKILELLDRYPRDWIIDAMIISVEQNKRSLAYFTAILNRWEAEGKDNGRGKPAGAAGQGTAGPLAGASRRKPTNGAGRGKPDLRNSPEDLVRYAEWERL
jgi:DnaD/phage-associated family protein